MNDALLKVWKEGKKEDKIKCTNINRTVLEGKRRVNFLAP